jgi:hypothetical protein
MKLLSATLFAASLTLLGCGGDAPAPATDAPKTEDGHGHDHGDEAPATETAATDAAATEGHGHDHGEEAPATEAPATDAAATEGHGHDHGEGAEGHHGAEGEELTGFDKMRAAGNPREADGWTVFGKDFTVTDAQPVSAVLASTADADGSTVRIEGTVADVCSKMGCWMVLSSGEDTIRITMKEHGFGVDRDCAGKTASLEGVLRSKKVDKELAEHYKSESTNPDVMPEAGKETVWEIVATTVALKPAA